MLSFVNDVFKTVRAVIAKITYTKYLLGLITVGFTVVVLPLFRFISKEGKGEISKAADATYWVLTCLFGIGILVYPWWLATAKSPLYYSRLQLYGRIISIIILVLASVQGIFNPDRPFSKNDPEHTTVTYRVVSCFTTIALLGGMLIALPILIRRDRLFKSNSQALFRFAWLFTLVMILGMVLNRTLGYNRIVAYSCILIVVQFFVFDYLEAVERRRCGKVGIFDEAYIIVAGFVPFWIAFAVGGTLLEIVSQASSVGTIFVYISWRVIIYAFEYLSSEVGRKASRYSDGSVFAYSAIYTGAAFGNFIFLSVKWNSPTFWALLVITALNIILVNGGLVIDLDYLFVVSLPVSAQGSWLHSVKILYYEFVRGEDPKMAAKIANCGAQPSAELQLYLIRSRAKFLQFNWVHNDIKMSSEFQALACACTAVGMEMVYSYYNVGADSITAHSNDRRDNILYIFCVQVLFVFCAQAVARRRLRHKVSRLKHEISLTVKALHSPTSAASSTAGNCSASTTGDKVRFTRAVDNERQQNDDDAAAAKHGTTAFSDSKVEHVSCDGGGEGQASCPYAAAAPVASLSVFGRVAAAASATCAILMGCGRATYRDVARGDVEMGTRDNSEDGEDQDTGLLISSDEVDADALNAILGLCSLYAEDAQEQDEEKEDHEEQAGQDCVVAGADIGAVSSSSPVGSSRITSMRFLSPFLKQDMSPPKAAGVGPKSSPLMRNRPDNRKVNFLHDMEAAGADNIDNADDEDDWEEVQLTNARADFHSDNAANGLGKFQRRASNTVFGAARRGTHRQSVTPNQNPSAVRMQGYLQKRKPGTTATYQRRFFILTNRQLMWFANEEDVEMHINRRKGALNLCNITHLDRYDPSSLCIVNVTVGNRVYILLAETRALADEWYDMMQSIREAMRVVLLDSTTTTATALDALPEVDEDSAMNTFTAGTSQPSTRQSVLPSAFGTLATLFSSDASSIPHASAHRRNSSMPVESGSGGYAGRVLLRSAASTRFGLETFFSSVFADESGTTEIIAPDAWKESWDVQNMPCKEGYILKKGELNAQWQHRWFVLDPSGVLSWYERANFEEGQKPRGTLAVWEISSVKPTDFTAPRLIVLLHIHGRVFELEACSELDASDWRHILQSWVASARAAVEAYHSEQLLQVRGEEEQRRENDISAVSSQVACRKTGFLQKRGGFNPDWRRRWFELDHPGVLSWYDKPYPEGLQKQQKVKGSLSLLEVMCIKVMRGDEPCLIEIAHMQGRTYELLAANAVEAEEWRVQLNLWLREAYNIVKEKNLQNRNENQVAGVSCVDTEPTEQASLVPLSSTRDVESEKLEASKKRYFMYAKWGKANKLKEKRELGGSSATPTTAAISLSAPCLGANSPVELSETPLCEESKESPAEGKLETIAPVTDAIDAQSKYHAMVAAIIANDPLAASEEPEEFFVVPSEPISAVASPPSPSAPVAGTRRPFSMAQTILSPELVSLDAPGTSVRRTSASPGALSTLYGGPENGNGDRNSPSPVMMLTENPHRKVTTPRRASAVLQHTPKKASPLTTPIPRRRHIPNANTELQGRRTKRQNILSTSPTLAKRSSGRGSVGSRRDSDLADTKFMDHMGKRHSSELVNNLHKRSYKDMNAEFWDTHLWYLSCVVCFVTLNVLYTTSYIMTQNEI